MKTRVRGIVALLGAATVVSCQQLRLWSEQAEYNRAHEAHCLKEYNSHVESLSSGVARLHNALPKAVRAQWQWTYDCDACDDSLLPAPIEISRDELRQVTPLLAQANAMSPLPQSTFMTPPPRLSIDSEGNILKPVLLNPWSGCCGVVSPVLVLYDINNQQILHWDESSTIPTSRVTEHSNDKSHLRPTLVLPDAAYHQLLTLPSFVKVRQKDDELQKKLKQHSHCSK